MVGDVGGLRRGIPAGGPFPGAPALGGQPLFGHDPVHETRRTGHRPIRQQLPHRTPPDPPLGLGKQGEDRRGHRLTMLGSWRGRLGLALPPAVVAGPADAEDAAHQRDRIVHGLLRHQAVDGV